MFQVYIAHQEGDDSGAYSTLNLPAQPFELLDALDRARVTEDSAMYFAVEKVEEPVSFLADYLWCDYSVRSLYTLNALAEKVSQMEEEQLYALEGLVSIERGKGTDLTPSLLYDLAFSTDQCHVIGEAVNNETLGRFYADNGFLPELEDIPENVSRMLNFETIGREARRDEGGVFLSGGKGYVVWDGDLAEASEYLTFPRPDYTVLLELGTEEAEATTPVKFPAPPGDLAAALDRLDPPEGARLKWCCVDCLVPALAETVSQASSLANVNHVSLVLKSLEKKDIPAYKAILEAKGPMPLKAAMDLTDKLKDYVYAPEINDPMDVAREKLYSLLSKREAESLLPHVNLTGFGEDLIAQYHLSITSYGSVSRADGQPLARYAEEEHDEKKTDRESVRQTARGHTRKKREASR